MSALGTTFNQCDRLISDIATEHLLALDAINPGMIRMSTAKNSISQTIHEILSIALLKVQVRRNWQHSNVVRGNNTSYVNDEDLFVIS